MLRAGVRSGPWGPRFAALAVLCALGGLTAPLVAEPGGAGQGEVRYSHKVHEGLGIKLNCSSCHGSTSAGELSMVGQDNHKPCVNQACHAAAFREAGATICKVCHEHNEAWRANPVRGSFRDTGEFWVGFSHKSHLTRSEKGILAGKGCQTCHPTQAGEAPAPQPAGVLAPAHGLCASCHEGLAEPKMTSCDGCHRLEEGGVVASVEEPGAWRVGMKFEHKTHRVDVRTAKQAKDGSGQGWTRYAKETAKELDCKACHGEVLQADAGDRLPRPKMEGCGSCHNGSYAFKATGFGCTKCHGAVASSGSKPTASR